MTKATDLPLSDGPLLEVRGLTKSYAPRKAGWLAKPAPATRVVSDVSFAIGSGRTVALVGESGCGKTTTARIILQLVAPDTGELLFEGQRLQPKDRAMLRRYRAKVQAVFQDPWSALNPRMRVGESIAEPLRLNSKLSRAEIQSRVEETLRDVGLDPAMARNFPHEFSGGQRQRVAIARAIILRPALVVLDEPVSALDVSVRLQVVNLLVEAQKRLGMSYLLISHDLATVRYQANDIAVMYRGVIVEEGASETVFENPKHPYTQALFEAARFVPPGTERPQEDRADIAAPSTVGCSFAARCPKAFARCFSEAPTSRLAAPQHRAACHLYEPIEPSGNRQ
jgi:oligopeptide/dipeptide ABC transporter ATP-binding protein